ncbi:MAG TPA: hypothetical protein VD908_16625 [Cytophagales bacterium]|nr:hypothetical protein [Cytophagales bacterium]
MRKTNIPFLLFLLATMPFLQSCEVIGDIFGAGVWVGVTIVLIIIVGLLWLFSKMRS